MEMTHVLVATAAQQIVGRGQYEYVCGTPDPWRRDEIYGERLVVWPKFFIRDA